MHNELRSGLSEPHVTFNLFLITTCWRIHVLSLMSFISILTIDWHGWRRRMPGIFNDIVFLLFLCFGLFACSCIFFCSLSPLLSAHKASPGLHEVFDKAFDSWRPRLELLQRRQLHLHK